MSSSTAEPQKKFNKGRLAAFAFGNFGQSLLYNALSTYFMVFATNALFAGVDKTTAADMTPGQHHHLRGLRLLDAAGIHHHRLSDLRLLVKLDEKVHARIVAKIEAKPAR